MTKLVTAIAFAARMGVVLWAKSAIPPTADGSYYHKLATRIAAGSGYTWLWDDGVVTYAAHYPVGYPALIAPLYALFGGHAFLAMIVNAVLGTAATYALHRLVLQASSARLAFFAGLAMALQPVLVPYTAALMTEGVTASLLVIATALAARAREEDVVRPFHWVLASGIVMGVCTLVRPQSLVLAPVLGWLALGPRGIGKALSATAVATVAALLVCAPWTGRNCTRMERCALVSVNGGWNLAIGTQTESGGWHEITVPEACKTVFHEAKKDECFEREARKVIVAHPMAWLRRAPAKLRVTFDYFGAAPWYLHTANAEAFPYRAKVVLGTIETIASRLLLAAALVSVFKMEGPLRRARKVICAIGLVACVLVPGTIGYLALALAILLLGKKKLERVPVIVPVTAIVIAATAIIHAVFFGAGRYGIVVVPFVTALAFVRPSSRERVLEGEQES